jgi:hypothetical protein
MTAGPIERAFRFLKRTSVNCGAPADGAGVTAADNGGVVLAGDAAADEPGAAGADASGDSSWATTKQAAETQSSEMENETRAIMVDQFNQSYALGDAGDLMMEGVRAVMPVRLGPP